VSDRARLSHETKLAMFWVALATQCAGERSVTGKRIAASLLRTDSLRELCSRKQIDSARLFVAVEEPGTPSFEECQRRVRSDLAEKGLAFASKEHQATVQPRPLDPIALGVVGAILERDGHLGASPLELLLDLIRADAGLAELLAPHGLDAESIRAALEER
jgi:hypothetical protein